MKPGQAEKIDVIMQLTLIWLLNGSPIYYIDGHCRQDRPNGTTYRSVHPKTVAALEARDFIKAERNQWILSDTGRIIAKNIINKGWALK